MNEKSGLTWNCLLIDMESGPDEWNSKLATPFKYERS